MELHRLHRAAALMFAPLALPPGYYAVTAPIFGFLFGAVGMALRARWRV